MPTQLSASITRNNLCETIREHLDSIDSAAEEADRIAEYNRAEAEAWRKLASDLRATLAQLAPNAEL